MPGPAFAPSARGRFLWYELMTTDVAGAKEFYRKAVGWDSAPWEGASAVPSYHLWTNGGTPLGGLMDLPEQARAGGAPPSWTAYISTPDVDGTIARGKTLNGSVLVEPVDLPDVGRFAILSDPQGAMFAVYTPSAEPHPEADPAVGQVSWHELATTDTRAAFAFYQNLFGWENQSEMDMGPMGVYLMYGRGGRMYGGIYNKPAEMPGPPSWLLYVLVDDVNASVPRITEAGGTLLNGPMEVPGGDLIAQFLDPQGAAFAIHSKKKA